MFRDVLRVPARVAFKHVTILAYFDQINGFSKRYIARCNYIAMIVGGQFNGHTIVHIGPIRVVILHLGEDRYLRHKPERGDKIREFKFSHQSVGGVLPSRWNRQWFVDVCSSSGRGSSSLLFIITLHH